jgi:hypothetical protein
VRSPHVCALTGLTYRQLDFLTRSRRSYPLLRGPIPARGSGNARRWPRHVVRRLMITAHAERAGAGRDLPELAERILAGPEPPDAGWLILGGPATGLPDVAYASDPAEMCQQLLAAGGAFQVIDYDLEQLAVDAGLEPGQLPDVLAGAVPRLWQSPAQQRRHLTGARP